MAKNKSIVADICLYGTSVIGYGYLAQVKDGQLVGDGKPCRERSATEAVWLACQEIRNLGIAGGSVRVFCPTGLWMATTDLSLPAYYGNLKWERAIQYVVGI